MKRYIGSHSAIFNVHRQCSTCGCALWYATHERCLTCFAARDPQWFQERYTNMRLLGIDDFDGVADDGV